MFMEGVLWKGVRRGRDGELVFGEDVGVAQESVAAFDIFDGDVILNGQSDDGIAEADLRRKTATVSGIDGGAGEPYAEGYRCRALWWRRRK